LDVTFLRRGKAFGDIEKAIKAYLKYRPRIEPWMYEQLALAIEINKGPASEIKTALGWAGYLARSGQNPDTESMIRVGDLMLLKKIYEVPLKKDGKPFTITAGELFDEANRRVPTRPEPILLSINLAGQLKDPQRMGDAVEKLLSLGWPGVDEAWRADAEQQVKKLAIDLSEKDRDKEANELRARAREASTRDVFVRLSWIGDAGMELRVDEPLGATASYVHPRTVFGGAIVKNMYGTKNAECIYTCPRGFDGDYKINVDVIYNDKDKPVSQAILEIVTHEGTKEEKSEKKIISVANPKPVVVTLKGGRRKEVLPFQADSPKQVPDMARPSTPATKPPAAARGPANAAPIR
jgi:hypothetical protein